MDAFRLVEPSTQFKESYLAGLREFRAEGLAWYAALDLADIEAHFESYVAALASPEHRHSVHPVRETVLWGVLGGDFAGKIAIRHELNDELRALGGHIGYDTRPGFRGRGLASRMLASALPHARELGLKQVLLTCDDTNTASIRVIEKNGGVLAEKKRLAAGRPEKRYYWITL